MNRVPILRLATTLIVASIATNSDARINEVRFTDNERSYFEIIGPAGADISAFHYLVIGDGEDGNSGVIETVIPLQGVIPEDGVYLAGESRVRPSNRVDFQTEIGFERNHNVTHLVVGGFTGDLGTDLDINDDCRVDGALPWGRVIDGIAFLNGSTFPQSVCHYGGDALGEELSFPIIKSNDELIPSQVSSVPDGSNNYVGRTRTPGDQNSYYVHDTFNDGHIDDLSPVSWQAGERGTLSVENGDLKFVISEPTNGGVAAITENGELPARDDWSLRARLTVNDFVGFGLAGVGVSGGRFASLVERDNSFVVGEGSMWKNTPIDELKGKEVVVQVRVSPEKIDGQFWLPDEPGDFISSERPNNAGGAFVPLLANIGSDATFHEVWMSTEPLPLPVQGTSFFADFNADRNLDAADIDLLSLLVRSGSDRDAFDLDENGSIEQEDRRMWIEDVFGSRFGDANLDKQVDMADFLELSKNFGSMGGWSKGDFDGNGYTQFRDFLMLSQNFGATSEIAAAVPEPASSVWLWCFLGTLFWTRSARRAQRK